MRFLEKYKFKPTETKEFWIEQIANSLGEKIVSFKGSGSFGWAYLTKSGKILKMTTDPEEIKLAYRLSKNRNWFQYIINYYNVGRINKKADPEDDKLRRVYYILMDKVDPIEDPDEACVIDDVYQNLIQYKLDYYENVMDKKKVKERINEELYTPYLKKLAKKLYPHVVNIVKELKKHKIKSTDFHSGNIGWANNKSKLVLYDLGGYVAENPSANKEHLKKKIKNLKVKNKRIKEFFSFTESNKYSCDYYIGVDLDEAISWCNNIPIPTPVESAYPVDWEVIEYSIGGEITLDNDEEIEEYVKDECPWYNGSLKSLEGGLNVLGDFDNAKGYGNYVLGVDVFGETANFTDEYVFVKDCKETKLIFIYDNSTRGYYSPEEFKFIADAKKYNM